MAHENRTATDRLALFEQLRSEPHQFDFYQALRRIEAAFAEKPRIGQSLRLADDPVRLAQEPSMIFAPSTIAAFDYGKDGRAPRLTMRHVGMFGPNGPLPLHLTEYARDRMRNSSDHTFTRFMDIFHHRMYSLFYRAWAVAQPTAQFDRPKTDRFAEYIGSLFGMGMPSFRNRDAMPDMAKLHFSGRLACQTRHAEGLAALLNAFFKIPMKLNEFIGQWLPLPLNCRVQMGLGSDTGVLGMSATIGERVWDCQQKFRIVAGPMDFSQYRRLLPEGESLAKLISVVDNYVGLELDWEVHLILKKKEVPSCQLGSMGQLGWTTWLKSRELDDDADDLILQPRAERTAA